MMPNTLKDEAIDSSARKTVDSPNIDMRETTSHSYAHAAPAETGVDAHGRLPHRISGGFRGLGDELERHSRDWRNAYRLLEQQRPMLEAAEAERDRLQEALGRLVPTVKDATKALTAGIDAARKGDISGDLAGQFNKSLSALDDLEALSESLTANMLQLRSTWEQYARTVLVAQKLREELKAPSGRH